MDSSPHPLQVMITDFKTPDDPAHSLSNNTDVERPEAPRHIQLTEQRKSHVSTIELTGIKQPALLIKHDLEIAWQNKGAIEQIWLNIGTANNGNPSPKLFDLIFDTTLKNQITNYSQCLDFFCGQLLGLLPREELLEQISEMPFDRQAVLTPLLENALDRVGESHVSGAYLNLNLDDGSQTRFKTVALNCNEGRLLIFEPLQNETPAQPSLEGNGTTHQLAHIRRQPNPVMTPYFILAAKINQASKLRTELLAEEHWRMINALYQGCMRCVERFGGVFQQLAGDGFCAYFLPDQNSEAEAMNVIECALELKSETAEQVRKWRISKNWMHDIDLNIGIHYEEAYVGTLPVSSGDLLTTFGEGERVAGAICRLATDGQIWTTKPVISRIPSTMSRSLRFGILKTNQQHLQRFMRNAFASIGSVFDLQSAGGSFEEKLSFLPITQIFDLSESVR